MTAQYFSTLLVISFLGLASSVIGQQGQFQNVNSPNRLLPFFQQPGVQLVQRLQRQFFQQQQQQRQQNSQPQLNLQVDQFPRVTSTSVQQSSQFQGPISQNFQQNEFQPTQNFEQRQFNEFDTQSQQQFTPIQQFTPVQQQQSVEQIPVQIEQKQRPVRQLMSEACVACLCQASTNCNLSASCVSEGRYCGPFLLSQPYWLDAGSPVLLGDSPTRPGAFEDCATDPVCSAQAVRTYMTKYMRDCNGDGRVDCDDLGRIHLMGSSGCVNPSVTQTPFYQRFSSCLSKASQLSI